MFKTTNSSRHEASLATIARCEHLIHLIGNLRRRIVQLVELISIREVAHVMLVLMSKTLNVVVECMLIHELLVIASHTFKVASIEAVCHEVGKLTILSSSSVVRAQHVV